MTHRGPFQPLLFCDSVILGQGPTGFQSASCRSLMRLKPVVKMFPSARKMARMGRAPSWVFSFSWKRSTDQPPARSRKPSWCWLLFQLQSPWQDTLLLHAGCRPHGATPSYLCPKPEGRNQLQNYQRSGHSWLLSALPIRLLQG